MYHSPSGSADYQHSEAEQHHSQTHSHHPHHHHHHVGHHSHHQQNHIQNKYSDGVNGSDTLTDFVTFVCQEADNSQQNSQVSIICALLCMLDMWLSTGPTFAKSI